MVGIILGNGIEWTLTETDGIPLVVSIGSALGTREGFFLVIAAGGKVGTEVGC